MMGPRAAAEAFNAYVFLLVSAADADSLFEVIRQADKDSRLSRSQQEALDVVAKARGQVLKLGAAP